MAKGRVAKTKVCERGVCDVGHLLVRGDRVSFVSTEQVRRVGRHKLDAVNMPSDVELPDDYVLVHDTTGKLLNRCDLYVVRWHKGSSNLGHNVSQELIRSAHDYYGFETPVTFGRVDIPKGKWHRLAKVAFIRYRRVGDSPGMFEHEYDVPVMLYDMTRPLAWRLPLPEGCVVDARGFVRP